MRQGRDGVREVEPQLRDYLERLRDRVKVQSLVVFGSRARNDHWVDSDIDIVVVSPSFERMSRRDRIGLLLDDWGGKPALEPLGYTREEILQPDHLVLLDALHDGRILADDGTWQEARGSLKERMRRGEWTRTPGGWREALPSDRKSL